MQNIAQTIQDANSVWLLFKVLYRSDVDQNYDKQCPRNALESEGAQSIFIILYDFPQISYEII